MVEFSKNLRSLKRALARNVLYFFSWFFRWVPYRLMRAVTYFFIRMSFVFLFSKKRIARENLNIAFGQEKTLCQREQILRQCFSNFGQGAVEMLYFMSHLKEMGNRVTYQGWEHFERALQSGRGIIVVTAHFGNFPLMLFSLANKGYPVNIVMRPARDKVLEADLLRKRAQVNLRTIYAVPPKQCVLQCIRVLREKEILFILSDQNFASKKGVFVDFFGKKAATGTGPAILSLRTDAIVLPMFIVRQEDDHHVVMIEEPVQMQKMATQQETLLSNTQRITQVIESYIRRYPQEWAWMHNRWKTKEPGA